MAHPQELNEALVAGLPDEGPVVMVNLLRFLARSKDGNGSGWDAYQRYSQGVMPLIRGCGGTVLWAGNGEGLAFGDAARHTSWTYVVLVRYPSRAAFLTMVKSEAYALVNVHRENGVEDHVILAAHETYSKLA